MKPKFGVILSVAIAEGIRIGYRRAHKHTDTPEEDVVISQIMGEVLNSIHAYFDV